ncbi:MAG TPA: M56 family metallopeptidase, partial [Thermoclostridium sp.]
VKLMLNPDISSPMLVGVFRPVIFLPALNIQETDLKLILTHELMHLKRGKQYSQLAHCLNKL